MLDSLRAFQSDNEFRQSILAHCGQPPVLARDEHVSRRNAKTTTCGECAKSLAILTLVHSTQGLKTVRVRIGTLSENAETTACSVVDFKWVSWHDNGPALRM